MANNDLRRPPEFQLLAHAEELCREIYGATGRSPKWHKFRLAKKLEDEAFRLPLLVIEYGESRMPSKIYRLHEQCRYMHSLLRMAVELKALNPKSIEGIYSPLKALSNKVKAIARAAREAKK